MPKGWVMKTTTYNQFNFNNVVVYQKTDMDENGVTISQSYSPFESTGKPDISKSEGEVTHEKFFGENISRVMAAFRKK